MEDSMMSMKVDPKVVEGIIEKQIQTAIVSQLGNSGDFIAKAVSLALHTKVNEHGNVDRSSYCNNNDFMEVMTGNAIRKAATNAMSEWLEINSAKVKAAVLKELKKPSRQSSIAKAFADAVESSLKCSWNMKCNIDFQKTDD